MQPDIRTFVGKFHTVFTCERKRDGKKCEGRLVWNEETLMYKLCTNPECVDYYICRCGKEYGNHFDVPTDNLQ